MSNNDLQGMRMSLPPGTKVFGEKTTYEVKKFICMSDRSTTVICESAVGKSYRLKLFNGQHCISNELQKKAALIMSKGVAVPLDVGIFGGCPFAVYKNMDAVDASKYPIAQNILIKKIIPQLAFVINKYHKNRILLRDICPEHILYRVQEQQIAYCGFNNMTVLPDKATITKAPGYGQKDCYIAPEVPKYGYSIYADYYAFGVTLLSIMPGNNPLQNMSFEEIQKNLFKGHIPGVDIDHLKATAYELYSEEDKVLYLVLGLMNPNPKNRWGYGEIRCWCNNQHIPLIRKEGRIHYQYNEPFIVNKNKCWNYKQLTEKIAADENSWTTTAFDRLNQFANRQKIEGWGKITNINENSGKLTPSGIIFRCIYGINPALDGLWWEGKKYNDTYELINKSVFDVSSGRSLSEILRNQCLSYFLRMRKRISNVKDKDIQMAEQLEQWEISEPGKGTSRSIMCFSSNAQERKFVVKGTEYHNINQIISEYSENGLKLKEISSSIIQSEGFQAWLWANGMEEAGINARKICDTNPEQGFYLLLKIAENISQYEEDKKRIRKMYLKYGDYAPIYWLYTRIHDYRIVSIGDRILYDAIADSNFSLSESLDVLSIKLRRMVPDYQNFVDRTAKNSSEIKRKDLEFADFSFYPLYDNQFFHCRWDNNLPVCPAFLKYIGIDNY